MESRHHLVTQEVFSCTLWDSIIMGVKFEVHTAEEIEVIADSLLRAAKHFADVLAEMQKSKLESAYIEWSKRHGLALALMAGSSRAAVSMIEEQIVSHRRGEPSFYSIQAARTSRKTERERERREADQAAKGIAAATRGRPKKAAKKT